ncbi:hypothetical protein [Gemmobacter denitrificans]|uniref:DUF1127 domain-containing protein n=1 Tax=Gemmobacter denitrificans TaxID=3123040 RepID=A0ABU8BRB8_9RHOB
MMSLFARAARAVMAFFGAILAARAVVAAVETHRTPRASDLQHLGIRPQHFTLRA